MKNSKKFYSAQFKTKVALEALSQLYTIYEIASKHEVHVTQINRWKKRLIDNAPDSFSDKHKKQEESKNQEIEKLYQKIGQ